MATGSPLTLNFTLPQKQLPEYVLSVVMMRLLEMSIERVR
jgi:hypothetical protein